MRIIHQLVQGSPEWLAHRATPGIVNGSVIYAMLGLPGYITYSELLRETATGINPEIDAATQHRFDDGHANEAKALPIAEVIINDDLSAMVMSDVIDGVHISVSLDGITQGYDTTFEHKSLNKNLEAALDAGTIPDMYHPQMEAGLMVSGATRCLFMASRNGDMETARYAWYESNPALRPRIIAACKQFAEDVANYQHVEPAAPAVAAPIKDLPAIIITATGSLSVETNFSKWEIELRDFIKRIPEKPSTDQEFADCKAAVSAFKKAEEALDAEEARVLTMVPSVDDMRRHKKLLRDLSSTTRLALEKLVVARDIDVKKEIMHVGKDGIAAHIKALNERLGGQYIPASTANFADAIKNKRSYATMRESVNTMLANAKVGANMTADLIAANYHEMTSEQDWSRLFPDFASVCTKERDDFSALLMARIAKHDKAEAEANEARIKAEDARIAAALEAERIAEVKRIAESAQHEAAKLTANNQTQFIAPDVKRAAVVEAQDDIAAFMNSREWGKEAGKIRAVLVEFEAFKAGPGLAVVA
jgi:predicted phage-related endonuclease